jgi:hypothetical protein
MDEKNRSENPPTDKLKDLRRRAEEIAADQPSDLENADRLIHELQVHRIELEMQNEELRNAHLELEEARDRYADLFDFAPIGYITVSE